MKKLHLLLFVFLLSFALVLPACNEPTAPNPPGTSNPNDPTNPIDPPTKSTDGFAELTEGLRDGDTVSATLSYKAKLLETTFLSGENAVPAEYIFTTETQKTFKGIGFVTSAENLPVKNEQEFLEAISQTPLNLKGVLIQLQNFQVILATLDVKLSIGNETYQFTKHLIAYPNSLQLNTKINRGLTTTSITLLSEKSGVYSFFAKDTNATFIALGYNQAEQLASSFGSATFNFITQTVETSSGTAGEMSGVIVTEKEAVLPILALSLGFEKATEETTVLMCTDCKEDVVSILNDEELKYTDWSKYITELTGIPNWISAKEALPLSEKAGCEDIAGLFYESMYGANLYRLYYLELKNGSNLLSSGHQTGVKTYKTGSKEHDAAMTYFYSAMSQSYSIGQTLLETYDKLDCFPSQG